MNTHKQGTPSNVDGRAAGFTSYYCRACMGSKEGKAYRTGSEQTSVGYGLYSNAIVAPSSSSLAINSATSSFFTSFMITEGALSTSSLA